MQFSIHANDHSDSEAASRREHSRAQHLARVERLILEGKVLSAGALLDDAGRMVGSALTLEFDERAALNRWLEDEPYIRNRVWNTIDVHEVRLIDIGAVLSR